MARRGRLWSAAVAVSLLLGACAGGGEEAAGSATSGTESRRVTSSATTPAADDGATATAEPSPSSSESQAQNQAGGAAAAADAAFAYVPWGPDDPPVPQRYASLAAASPTGADCAGAGGVALAGPFWDLAVQVCRAIAGQGPWPSGTTVPPPPAAKNAYEACLDAELAAMLQRALRWRAANPQATAPAISYPARGALSPCQVTIFEARVLGTADPLHPGGAVPAGSLAVAVFAGSADGESTVSVDGRPVDVVEVEPSSGSATLVVLVPAPPQARTVPLAVSTTRGVLTSTVALPAATATTPPSTGHGSPSTDGNGTNGTGTPPATADDEAPTSPPASDGP